MYLKHVLDVLFSEPHVQLFSQFYNLLAVQSAITIYICCFEYVLKPPMVR